MNLKGGEVLRSTPVHLEVIDDGAMTASLRTIHSIEVGGGLRGKSIPLEAVPRYIWSESVRRLEGGWGC